MCPAPDVKKVERGYVIPIGGAVEKENNPVILEKFCQLSGGSEGRILVIPTASRLEETGPDYVKLFESMGAESRYIAVDQREDCFKPEIQEALAKATGIFITGGNQLRLSTILGGTPVAKMIRAMNAFRCSGVRLDWHFHAGWSVPNAGRGCLAGGDSCVQQSAVDWFAD